VKDGDENMVSASALAHAGHDSYEDHDRPVDLVHLARHTLGNRDLEHEVLRLFERQSVIYLSRLKDARKAPDRFQAAHTIKGSARGIGAWRVANLAEALEDEAPPVHGARKMIADLENAIGEANGFIREILKDD